MGTKKSILPALLLLAASAAFLSACNPREATEADRDDGAASYDAEPSTAVDGEATAMDDQELGDGEIIAVLHTVNQGELIAGDLASTQATSTEVREFAARMVQDHIQANDKVESVVTAEVSPAESALSRELADKADSEIADLRGLAGEEFDRVYMSGQVENHREVLRTIDERLLPAAESTAVRDLLETLRHDIAAHLAHAEEIQGTLDRVGG